MHAERIHPEMIFPLGIARRDVAGYSFAETEFAEEAKRRGQTLLSMQTLFSNGFEDGRFWRLRDFEGGRGEIGGHDGNYRTNKSSRSFNLNYPAAPAPVAAVAPAYTANANRSDRALDRTLQSAGDNDSDVVMLRLSSRKALDGAEQSH